MGKLIIGNLKMNLLSSVERDNYLAWMGKELKNAKLKNSEIVLCPPSVHLEGFKKWKNKKVKFGAQNMFSEEKGSYTGEISPVMLKNFGAEYVILGHSERRRYFSENNSEINSRLISALKHGLKPILCVGENKNQEIRQVVLEQLGDCLAGVNRGKIENVVICYEPVWAISANKPDHLPATNDIMSARLLIRKFLVEKYGTKIAERVKIIYGGSVASANVQETCINSGMEGVLVGKESLTPHEFVKIVQIIDK
ncbi:MAG TPA: triose-phosphate isomerase [Candidatus Moranbacteria bacterium]|nr:triose-phosphate isomerase [Candidatus Moranbacteria bacterium]